MAKQVIGIGTLANDGTGDTLRAALDKCNDNFTELYALTDGTGAASVLTLAAGSASLGTARPIRNFMVKAGAGA